GGGSRKPLLGVRQMDPVAAGATLQLVDARAAA
ncbi:hypothetical protein PMI40_01708, partial [Herbaspirillum sp. YR522]